MKDKNMLSDKPPEPTGIGRRTFLKTVAGTAAGIGLSQVINPVIVRAVEKALKNHPVLWLQGQGCTGCSVSLLNSVEPPIADVLLKIISLQYHPTVMASEGELALETLYHIAEEYKGTFSLVVEGAIPTAADGKYCLVGEMDHREITMMEMVKDLGAKADSILAVGTCASFGGIPAAEGSITGAKSVTELLEPLGIKTPVVNIAGCPPHPDWIVLTIHHLLTKGLPERDDSGRPLMFFEENIHDNCPHLDEYDNGEMSEKLSDRKGCRMDIGCKGPSTYADCFKRKWNSGLNWCIDNSVCIGCVEPGFPDASSPFYEPE